MDSKRDFIRRRISISSTSSSDSSSRSRSSSRSSKRRRHRRHSSRRSRSRSRDRRKHSSSRHRERERGREVDKDKDKIKKSEYVGTNSRDPKMIASRIYIGNIPIDGSVTKDDIESLFKKYGKIIGLLLMSGYAFVQYDNEESANKAREEAGTILKGNNLEVRLVTDKKTKFGGAPDQTSPSDPSPGFYPMPPHPGFYPGGPIPPPPPFMHPGRMPHPPFYDPFIRTRGMVPPPPMHGMPPMLDPYRTPYIEPPQVPTHNHNPLPPIATTVNKPLAIAIDCDIILVANDQRKYGENVKTRLLAAGLTVEIKLLPHDSTTLSMVEGAGRKGVLFAIIVNDQNEMHRSITVNILHGSPQEHRNMPLDDAITLITRSFDKYVLNKKERLAAASNSKDVFQPPGQNIVYLLNLLADSRFLTIPELDSVLDYLVERRNVLAKSKGMPSWPPQKERHHHLQAQQRVQKMIQDDYSATPTNINSMANNNNNSNNNSNNSSNITNANPTNVKEEKSSLSSVFDNPLVQKALNNLLNNGPNLLKSISNENSTTAVDRQKQQYSKQPQQQQQQQYYSPDYDDIADNDDNDNNNYNNNNKDNGADNWVNYIKSGTDGNYR